MDKTPYKRVADTHDQFDRLDRLHDADDARQHAKDTSLGTARNHARWRWFRVETAVAGPAQMRSKDGALAVEAKDGTVDVRLLQEDADIVGEIAGGKVVGSVNHDIIGSNDGFRVFRCEKAVVKVNLHVGVDLFDGVARAVNFFTADIARAVEDLALEVGEVNGVEIDKPDASDTRRRQIHGDRGAETARSDAEDAGGLEPLLSLEGYLGHDEVARITGDLVIAQFHGGGAGWIQDALAHNQDGYGYP